jgi:hypothetical protein
MVSTANSRTTFFLDESRGGGGGGGRHWNVVAGDGGNATRSEASVLQIWARIRE